MTLSTYRSRRPGEPVPTWLATPFSEPSATSAPAAAPQAQSVFRSPVPLPVFSALGS